MRSSDFLLTLNIVCGIVEKSKNTGYPRLAIKYGQVVKSLKRMYRTYINNTAETSALSQHYLLEVHLVNNGYIRIVR